MLPRRSASFPRSFPFRLASTCLVALAASSAALLTLIAAGPARAEAPSFDERCLSDPRSCMPADEPTLVPETAGPVETEAMSKGSNPL